MQKAKQKTVIIVLFFFCILLCGEMGKFVPWKMRATFSKERQKVSGIMCNLSGAWVKVAFGLDRLTIDKVLQLKSK